MTQTTQPGNTFETDDIWLQIFIEINARLAKSVGSRRERNDARLKNGRVFWQFDNAPECVDLSTEYRANETDRAQMIHQIRKLYGRSKAIALTN